MKQVWQEYKGESMFTPGGDPIWECPKCGDSHVYGIETTYNRKDKCPKCGIELRYPWEKDLT